MATRVLPPCAEAFMAIDSVPRSDDAAENACQATLLEGLQSRSPNANLTTLLEGRRRIVDGEVPAESNNTNVASPGIASAALALPERRPDPPSDASVDATILGYDSAEEQNVIPELISCNADKALEPISMDSATALDVSDDKLDYDTTEEQGVMPEATPHDTDKAISMDRTTNLDVSDDKVPLERSKAEHANNILRIRCDGFETDETDPCDDVDESETLHSDDSDGDETTEVAPVLCETKPKCVRTPTRDAAALFDTTGKNWSLLKLHVSSQRKGASLTVKSPARSRRRQRSSILLDELDDDDRLDIKSPLDTQGMLQPLSISSEPSKRVVIGRKSTKAQAKDDPSRQRRRESRVAKGSDADAQSGKKAEKGSDSLKAPPRDTAKEETREIQQIGRKSTERTSESATSEERRSPKESSPGEKRVKDAKVRDSRQRMQSPSQITSDARGEENGAVRCDRRRSMTCTVSEPIPTEKDLVKSQGRRSITSDTMKSAPTEKRVGKSQRRQSLPEVSPVETTCPSTEKDGRSQPRESLSQLPPDSSKCLEEKDLVKLVAPQTCSDASKRQLRQSVSDISLDKETSPEQEKNGARRQRRQSLPSISPDVMKSLDKDTTKSRTKSKTKGTTTKASKSETSAPDKWTKPKETGTKEEKLRRLSKELESKSFMEILLERSQQFRTDVIDFDGHASLDQLLTQAAPTKRSLALDDFHAQRMRGTIPTIDEVSVESFLGQGTGRRHQRRGSTGTINA